MTTEYKVKHCKQFNCTVFSNVVLRYVIHLDAINKASNSSNQIVHLEYVNKS